MFGLLILLTVVFGVNEASFFGAPSVGRRAKVKLISAADSGVSGRGCQLDDTGPQLLILQRWKTHVRMFDFSLDLLYNRIFLKYSWKSLFETTVTTSSKIENNLSFIVLIQVIQWDISGSFTCQSTCFIIILNMGKLYYDNYARPSIFSFLSPSNNEKRMNTNAFHSNWFN